ncbi:hypothetical protein GCM10011586_13610 [Silvibacterium dinghuense]|nr:hypothetical protein GCM10011586_13610 [Silvibacterium dinghuense]
MVGAPIQGWLCVVIVEKLKRIPEAIDEARMVVEALLRLEKCDKARSPMFLQADEANECAHVRKQ